MALINCPECGRSYVSGGVTNTTIKYNESSPYGRNAKSMDAAGMLGNTIDYTVQDGVMLRKLRIFNKVIALVLIFGLCTGEFVYADDVSKLKDEKKKIVKQDLQKTNT